MQTRQRSSPKGCWKAFLDANDRLQSLLFPAPKGFLKKCYMDFLSKNYSVSKKVLHGFLIKKHVKSIIYSHSIVKLLSGMTIYENKKV